jgi:hypothetical protein
MAIAQAVCNTFKKELLERKHDFANGGILLKLHCLHQVQV